MTTQTEALKLALEALKYPLNQSHENFDVDMAELLAHRAITAIEEALSSPNGEAQPEQRNVSEHLEPVAWKLVPREPTHEMLKAMDECSTEGYDERLYAGHASSVYMAAVDAAPTPPAQRKPLSDEEIILIVAECASSHQHTDIHLARAIEASHGIKE